MNGSPELACAREEVSMSTSKGIGRKNQGTSRRDFIKTAAVAAGAAGALSACDSAATSRSTAESKGLRIQMAGYDFDRVAALIIDPPKKAKTR